MSRRAGARGRVAVRLEGGIGDHLLGMRILAFVRRRFPGHEVVVYSDAGGSRAQLDVVGLSPHVDRVVAVRQRCVPESIDAMGRLENLDEHAVREMRSADVFLDAWGNGFFLAESYTLGVSFYEILASRPVLRVPGGARRDAARLLDAWPGARFVTLNLAKPGPECLRAASGVLRAFLEELLREPTVVVLNLFATDFRFSHWPACERQVREATAREELAVIRELSGWHERIVPVADQPIATVAALIERSRYFLGVDNGVKHLAWALDVPRTVFAPAAPDGLFLMRWFPDFHRLLPFQTSADQLGAHVAFARACLRETPGRSSSPVAGSPGPGR